MTYQHRVSDCVESDFTDGDAFVAGNLPFYIGRDGVQATRAYCASSGHKDDWHGPSASVVTPSVSTQTDVHVAAPPPAQKSGTRPGSRNKVLHVPVSRHLVGAINDRMDAGDTAVAPRCQYNEGDVLGAAKESVEPSEKGLGQSGADLWYGVADI